MNNKHLFLIALALLAMMLSCVVPGLPTATPVSAPAPTFTPDNQLPGMVAEMVAGALTQTAQALPPPSPTFTPEPTLTPTPIPVRSSLAAQGDNLTLFVDERAGYTVVIPQGWLAVRVNKQEYFDGLKLPEAAEPAIQSALAGIQNEDPLKLRLFAVDLQKDHIQDGSATTIRFIWDEAQTITFETDTDMQAIADALTQSITGLEVTSVDVVTPTGTQFGIIESETRSTSAATLRQKRIFFKAGGGMVTVLLTTTKDLAVDIIPAFDVIMDTIKLIPN